MPLRFKRYNKRYRRRRTSLSTRNITMRTSAQNQSKQILSLRNRIRNVERNCRPETQLYTVIDSEKFTNSTFATTNKYWSISAPTTNMHGQWLRSKGLNLRALIEYSDNYVIDAAVDHQRTCSFRILIYARTASGNNTIPITNIANIAASGDEYELNAIRPLKQGVTSYAKIYYDKSYTISSQNPIKRLFIRLNRIMNMHKETDDTHARGEIVFAFITAGLHFDSTYNQELKMSFVSTYAYSDVN